MSQCMEALERGNEIRLARAQVKRELRAGEIDLAEAMEAECMASMPLGKLLAQQPQWASKRVRRFLVTLGMAESRQVRELTERQKRIVLEQIDTPPRELRRIF